MSITGFTEIVPLQLHNYRIALCSRVANFGDIISSIDGTPTPAPCSIATAVQPHQEVLAQDRLPSHCYSVIIINPPVQPLP